MDFTLRSPTKTQCYWDHGIENTKLDCLLHHHAHVIMFEHSEPCEQVHCHLGTKVVLPEIESKAQGEDGLRECFNNGRIWSSPSRQQEALIHRKLLHSLSLQNPLHISQLKPGNQHEMLLPVIARRIEVWWSRIM